MFVGGGGWRERERLESGWGWWGEQGGCRHLLLVYLVNFVGRVKQSTSSGNDGDATKADGRQN